jgi:hypothetical protein
VSVAHLRVSSINGAIVGEWYVAAEAPNAPAQVEQ